MSLHTWRTEAFDIQEGVRQGVLFKASYEVSLAFPQSITKTTSLIVILVSAKFVASTILRILLGAGSKISFYIKRNSVSILIASKQHK